MADYKDYIVRYDIQASTQNAAIGLRELIALADKLSTPMKTVADSIKQVSSSITQLKQNSNFVFKPEINPQDFNRQLNVMLRQVRTTAAQMHAAIYEALSGNPLGTKAAQTGIGKGFQLAKGSAALKSQLDSNQKLIEEQKQRIDGLSKTLRTKLTDTQRANAEKSIAQARIFRDGLRLQQKEIRAALKEAEESEKAAAVAAKKTQETAQKTASTTTSKTSKNANAKSAGQARPMTNVTPAIIREWGKVFGNSTMKNLTVNIRGNASGVNGALTVIGDIQAALERLQAAAKFTIVPGLDNTAFTAAEKRLTELAGLSAAVMAPFGKGGKNTLTKTEKSQLADAKKQATAISEKMAKVQSRLTANQAKYAVAPTPALKGQITKDTNLLTTLQADKAKAEGIVSSLTSKGKASAVSTSIPVGVKIMTDTIAASIKSITPPPISVPAKVVWAKGSSLNQQLKAKTKGVKPIDIDLNTAPAIEKLEAFIAEIKAKSPQSIVLTATGAAPAGAGTSVGKTGKSGAGKGKGTVGAMPLTPKQYVDQLGKHLGRGFSLPSNYATQIADQQRTRAWQLDQMRRDAMAAFANPTPYESKEAAKAQKELAANRAKIAKAAKTRHFVRDYNFMSQFAKNQTEANILAKHASFFRKAAIGMPALYPELSAAEKLTYLNKVASLMNQSNVQIPWQLTSHMRALSQQLNAPAYAPSKGGGYVPVPARQMSMFDKARKWAYPFTGTTSFGQRTPMAVDMAKGMGVMFAIGGAMSAIGNSFSQAMEYQNTMKTTQAILQNGTDSYSQSNFRNMEELVREVGVKTKFSAPEVANAARFLAMAGFDINAINHSIRPIADLALIGDLDLGETADKMTNIMTTFGIKPELMRDAANIMTTTATRSNTDLMMLAESAKYGGGMARLYGSSRENPLENFAETMAIFGVMGNAGVQGSSAGTALRMMYMNLFNPNKKQQAVHDQLLTDYGISMYQDEAKTKRRSMADIIKDIANKVPQAEMADLVSKLFRITATSGASAVLQAAEVDQSQAEQSLAENDAIVKQLTKGNTFSQLARLIDANVKSIGGNISGAIGEEKQNTIQGLWAQVTSTFTEGIVKAFEQRQGGFESMLKGLRDYLAKPETVAMLQNLLDMVIEIGKVLADVVALWAKIYSTAPGLIKFWVKWQMIFTQVGSFIAPVVALIGVFNRLGAVIGWLTGVSSVGATTMGRAATGGAAASAANAAMYAPLMVGTRSKGKSVMVRGNLAARTRQALTSNAILAGELALSGADYAATKATLDTDTRRHAKAVQLRAQRIYGTAPRIARAFRGGLTATLSMASLSSLFGGIGKLFTGLMAGLAKGIGLLFNPITLTIGAAVGLGYGLFQLKQRIDGVTDAQIRSRKEAQIAISQTVTQLNKQGEWHKSLLTEGMPEPIKVISSAQKEKIVGYEKARQDFQNSYAILFKDFTKDASEQSINDVTKEWRQMILTNRQNRLAIGNRWANLAEQGLVRYTEKYLPYQNQVNPTLANSLVASNSTDAAANGLVESLVNRWYMDEGHAKELRDEMMVQALMMEGGNSTAVQKVVAQLIDLKKKILTKAINPDTKQPYDQAYFNLKAQELRNSVRSMWSVTLPASELTIEKYRQTDDRSMYDAYQTGALNVIDAYIQGLNGTKIAVLENQIKLQGKLSEVQDVWFDAVAAVASGYTFFDEFTSKDGKRTADVSFQLNILPSGLIDFSSLEHQIMEKVGAFKLNLQKFSDIAATFYNSLGTILNERELYNLILKQNVNKDIDEATARQYYREHIANNTSNRWYKAGFTEQQYVDFVMDKSNNGYGRSTKFGNTTVRSADERVQMRKTISGDSARAVTKSTKEVKEKAEQTAGKGNAGTGTPPPKTTSTPRAATDGGSVSAGGNQDVYASHYAKDAARPAVVNININELAHFDRTTIASSAEERDLIAAMESRITDSVYRILTTASNSVSVT